MPSTLLKITRRLARRASHSRILQALAPERSNARGDVLDRQVAAMLLVERLGGPPLSADLSLDQRRQSMKKSCFLAAANPIPCTTERGEVGGLSVRWYLPEQPEGGLVFLHGGGWALGDLSTHDGICRKLAVGSGRMVVSVDYPRSPEAPFPEPLNAVVDRWPDLTDAMGRRGVPVERVAIGGDSAGGNLAAAACHLLRGGGLEPECQLLIYPGLDATRSGASHAEFKEGLVLSAEAIRYYLEQYDPEPLDPLASPVLAEDLEGLPPAIVIVAGFDPLRDEGLLYAERLRAAGVEVELLDFGTLIHGFANMDGLIDAADHALASIAGRLHVGLR